MIRDQIAEYIKILRFSQNMVDNSMNLGSLKEQQYFLNLLQLEVEHRETIRIQRLIKNAGFYSMKSFDNFIFDDINMPSGIDSRYLSSCEFIKEKRNCICQLNNTP